MDGSNPDVSDATVADDKSAQRKRKLVRRRQRIRRKKQAGSNELAPVNNKAPALKEVEDAPAPAVSEVAERTVTPVRPSLTLESSIDDAQRRIRRKAFWTKTLLWLSFLVLVAAPSGVAGWYLWQKAADQYASTVSFAVRSLDGGASSSFMDLFVGASGDSTTNDSQMLYEFIQSQPIVEKIDETLDLRAIYNRPEADEIFALGESRTVEELVSYWNLAVTVSYDSTGGIIHVESRAFRAEDAQAVAQAVLAESEQLINGLSIGARADAVRFAQVDLVEAEERVRAARLALQDFRSSQGTADISADITQEMTLIAGLRGTRAGLQADYDSRKDLLGADSPSLSALARQIESVDTQIKEAERRIAAEDSSGGGSLADAAGEQENLLVELEFATNMYTGAQAALERARAESRRAQRYLAAHIAPTLADKAEYPDRMTWSIAIFVILLLIWSIALLIISSIRDRN